MNDERADEADLTERSRTATIAAGAVLDDAGESTSPDPATAARVDAWLLGAASTGRRSSASARSTSARSTSSRSTGTPTAEHRSRGRVFAAVGAIAIVAGVLVLVTTRGDKTAAPTAATKPSSATTNAVRPVSTVKTVATTAPAATVSTSAPASTSAATTAPATTSPATTAPATTIAASPALGEADEFLALVEGRYPTGQAWPHGVFTDGKVVLTGVVPDQATKDRVLKTFVFPALAPALVDSMTIDPTVPAPASVLWTVLDAEPFEPGSARMQVTEGLPIPKGDTIVALWSGHFKDDPQAHAIIVVRRDSAGELVAQQRADALKKLFADSDPSLRQVLVALTSTTIDTGSQVAFALRLAA